MNKDRIALSLTDLSVHDLILGFKSAVGGMERAIDQIQDDQTAHKHPFSEPSLITRKTTGFTEFVSAARSLIVAPLQNEIKSHQHEIENLIEWMDPHDVLSVAGVTDQENPYSDLFAWSLDPTMCRGAQDRQREWLLMLGLIGSDDNFSPATPIREYPIANGRVDLLLDYDDFTVLIEAKTVSTEHFISGNPQTEYYPSNLRKLPRFQNKNISIVFLTTSGQKGKSQSAINTTFGEYAQLLCQKFNPNDYEQSESRPLSVLITHFVNSAWAGKNSITESLAQAIQVTGSSTPTDRSLLNNLDNLRAVLDLITQRDKTND